MAHYITSILKDSGGEITGYQLENGQLLSKAEGVSMAKQGLIEYVTVSTSKFGEEYLRSTPDEYSNNNLSNLPSITNNKIDDLSVVADESLK
ncbi:MAG TPA: DUF3892 domain-containing protein [Epulopiscium sp.]|nr:DUF3892 domain-containing protein [Candidatus Epulonipiscium sp.]